MDIFVIATIPEMFTQTEFLNSLITRLTPKGKIIFNTMPETMSKENYTRIPDTFFEQGLKVKVIREVEYTNDLIIAEK